MFFLFQLFLNPSSTLPQPFLSFAFLIATLPLTASFHAAIPPRKAECEYYEYEAEAEEAFVGVIIGAGTGRGCAMKVLVAVATAGICVV